MMQWVFITSLERRQANVWGKRSTSTKSVVVYMMCSVALLLLHNTHFAALNVQVRNKMHFLSTCAFYLLVIIIQYPE